MSLKLLQFGESTSYCLLYPGLICHLIAFRANPQQFFCGCAIGLSSLGQCTSKHL